MPTGNFDLQIGPDGAVYAWERWEHKTLYRLEGRTWTQLISQPPAPLLGIDPAGRVWAASPALAAVWQNGAWAQFDAAAGWTAGPEECYWSSDWKPHPALFASDGMVWIAGCDEVRRFDGQTWRSYTLAEMGMTDTVSADDRAGRSYRLVEAHGKIWVAECSYVGPGVGGGAGVRWFDGRTWQGADTPVAEGCGWLARAPTGELWAVINKGLHSALYQYQPDTAIWAGQPFPAPEGDDDRVGTVLHLDFDAPGDLWVGLDKCSGAGCDAGKVLYHYGLKTQIFTQVGSHFFYPLGSVINPSTLLFDAQGEGWLFVSAEFADTGAGLYRLVGDQFEQVATVPVSSAARAPDGTLWTVGRLDEQGRTGLWVLPP